RRVSIHGGYRPPDISDRIVHSSVWPVWPVCPPIDHDRTSPDSCLPVVIVGVGSARGRNRKPCVRGRVVSAAGWPRELTNSPDEDSAACPEDVPGSYRGSPDRAAWLPSIQDRVVARPVPGRRDVRGSTP